MVQNVLSLATQESDNPDLRDRGYIYWRLLSTDPAAAKDVVLAEKPLISEETDIMEPTLLDELICHIASLASVYHKPPATFVEGVAAQATRRQLPTATAEAEDHPEPSAAEPKVRIIIYSFMHSSTVLLVAVRGLSQSSAKHYTSVHSIFVTQLVW